MVSESRREVQISDGLVALLACQLGRSSAHQLKVQIAREVSQIWNVHKTRWFCIAGTLEGVHRTDHMIVVVEDEITAIRLLSAAKWSNLHGQARSYSAKPFFVPG
jgi:hypothetical protein